MITRIGIFLALALVLMAPLASAETFIIADIRVEGLQRVSAGTVFAALPVAVGDVVDDKIIRELAAPSSNSVTPVVVVAL